MTKVPHIVQQIDATSKFTKTDFKTRCPDMEESSTARISASKKFDQHIKFLLLDFIFE